MNNSQELDALKKFNSSISNIQAKFELKYIRDAMVCYIFILQKQQKISTKENIINMGKQLLDLFSKITRNIILMHDEGENIIGIFISGLNIAVSHNDLENTPTLFKLQGELTRFKKIQQELKGY